MLGGIDFIFAAIAVSMVVKSVRGGGGNWRRRDRDLPAPIQTEDPRVGMLQAEVDDLRTQVERLAAAEQFYAQLRAPAPPARESAAAPSSPAPPGPPPL
jgi:hypothetical protein